MIRLVGDKPPDELVWFLVWIPTVIDVKHTVTIDYTYHLAGLYTSPEEIKTKYIHVTGEGDEMLDTCAHEMVHYEQDRDGRKLNERGVKQRAAALVRRWKRERDEWVTSGSGRRAKRS